MESKEHHITHKEQHELNEQQLGSVKGGGLKRAKATWDLTELGKSLSDIENSSKVKNPLKRTAEEAGLPDYHGPEYKPAKTRVV
jgi:hypothetical protein